MPAFLLAKFALSGTGRTSRVRCVLRQGRVIESAVVNIGVEKDFHSSAGMFRDAESMLGERESEFAEELDRWEPGPLDRAGSAVAEEMVAQLRLRSREFRELGHRLFSGFVRDGGQVLTRAKQQGHPAAPLKDHLADALMAAISNHPPVTIADCRELVDTAVKPLLSQHLNHWVLEGASRMVQTGIESGLPAGILAGIHTHLIVLQIVNFRRHQTFGDMRWRVVDVAGEELILGDVGPLCLFGKERRLSNGRASNLPLRGIFLPIGPRRLLVGTSRSRLAIPTSTRLNNATMALSREFVVGRHSRSWFEKRTDFRSRADALSPERTLGVDVPHAADVLDPVLASVRTWVDSVIDRHWTGRADGPVVPATLTGESTPSAANLAIANRSEPTPSVHNADPAGHPAHKRGGVSL